MDPEGHSALTMGMLKRDFAVLKEVFRLIRSQHTKPKMAVKKKAPARINNLELQDDLEDEEMYSDADEGERRRF